MLKRYIAEAYKATDIGSLYQRVLVDGGIRWNSVYRMIERGKFKPIAHLAYGSDKAILALKLRDAIDLFFLHWEPTSDNDVDISKDRLGKQDWIDFKHFYNILKPFKDLTKRMEGRASKAGLEGSHGALWETLEAMDVLFKRLQEAG